MQVHRITLVIVDHNDIGGAEVRDILESTRYANECIYPYALLVETRDVEWSDSHPLNNESTRVNATAVLFDEGKDK